jgi:hypothetical protein
MMNDQRLSWLCGTKLRLIARLALVAAYFEGSSRAAAVNAPTL